MKFLIIGAGFFGLSIAIKIKEKYPNSEVKIFEKEKDIRVVKTNLGVT